VLVVSNGGWARNLYGYLGFGFTPLPDNPLQLFLPLQTIREALAQRA
jgi:hypothetical protein